MAFVVDASVAMGWLLSSQADALTERRRKRLIEQDSG